MREIAILMRASVPENISPGELAHLIIDMLNEHDAEVLSLETKTDDGFGALVSKNQEVVNPHA